ncbi:hypothetical protein Bca52824_078727 [Brassica carinata]|uniref:Uncharacterized protein n=1 Tax=Brassica carinata TaxID=52824 RepID=A0A8X7PYD8_BRACI|nr:hypothetical protein Bca52824_078727 [Brassica carinata]
MIGVGTGLGTLFLVGGIWWLRKFIKKRRMTQRKRKFFKRNGGLLLQQQLNTERVTAAMKENKFFDIMDARIRDACKPDQVMAVAKQGDV